MKGYLNILKSNEKIYLSLSNAPLPKREKLSEPRLINATKESLENIHIVKDTVHRRSDLFYISTFDDNGFSLCLFPLLDYDIIDSHEIRDIYGASKIIYMHRITQELYSTDEILDQLIDEHQKHEGFSPGCEILDRLIDDIKNDTVRSKIKFMIKAFGIPIDEEKIDPLISHVEAYQQNGSLVSLLEFGLKIQKNR